MVQEREHWQGELVMGILLPRCYFCGRVPSAGIHGGYKIGKAFICTACESKIIGMEIDSPGYLEIMEKLKMIIK